MLISNIDLLELKEKIPLINKPRQTIFSQIHKNQESITIGTVSFVLDAIIQHKDLHEARGWEFSVRKVEKIQNYHRVIVEIRYKSPW